MGAPGLHFNRYGCLYFLFKLLKFISPLKKKYLVNFIINDITTKLFKICETYKKKVNSNINKLKEEVKKKY